MNLTKEELSYLQKDLDKKYHHILNNKYVATEFQKLLNDLNEFLKFILTLPINNTEDLKNIFSNYEELDKEYLDLLQEYEEIKKLLES